MVVGMPGGKPTKELSIGESLSIAFHLYYRNFMILVIPLFVTSILSGVLYGLILAQVNLIPPYPPNSPPLEILNWFSIYWAPLLLYLLIAGIIIGLVGVFASGITVRCTADLIENRTTSLDASARFTIGKFLKLVAAYIIVGLALILGFIALIIPGIILAVILSLVSQAIIIEGKGVFDSLSRSISLVRRRWLKTFAFILLVSLLLGLVSIIISEILSPLASGNYALSYSLSSALTGLVIPLSPIAMTVYYYSMAQREASPAFPSVSVVAPPPPNPPPL